MAVGGWFSEQKTWVRALGVGASIASIVATMVAVGALEEGGEPRQELVDSGPGTSDPEVETTRGTTESTATTVTTVAPTSTSVVAVAPAGVAVEGRWVGTYHCLQGLTGLDLEIDDLGGGVVAAVFRFSVVPSNSDVPSGSFHMEGRYDDRGLRLEGADWIDRPASYITVDLTATWSGGPVGGTISGNVDGSGCTTFSVTRRGS